MPACAGMTYVEWLVCQGQSGLLVWTEPPRVCRRLFGLSYAAIGMVSSVA
jgi:hypothetical protein